MDSGSTVYGTRMVNNQLVPELMSGQVFPSAAYVPYYAGRGAPTPTLPGVVTGDSGGNVVYQASDAGSAPWDPQKSPVVWAIAFIIIGWMGLRWIHWNGDV